MAPTQRQPPPPSSGCDSCKHTNALSVYQRILRVSNINMPEHPMPHSIGKARLPTGTRWCQWSTLQECTPGLEPPVKVREYARRVAIRDISRLNVTLRCRSQIPETSTRRLFSESFHLRSEDFSESFPPAEGDEDPRAYREVKRVKTKEVLRQRLAGVQNMSALLSGDQSTPQ